MAALTLPHRLAMLRTLVVLFFPPLQAARSRLSRKTPVKGRRCGCKAGLALPQSLAEQLVLPDPASLELPQALAGFFSFLMGAGRALATRSVGEPGTAVCFVPAVWLRLTEEASLALLLDLAAQVELSDSASVALRRALAVLLKLLVEAGLALLLALTARFALLDTASLVLLLKLAVLYQLLAAGGLACPGLLLALAVLCLLLEAAGLVLLRTLVVLLGIPKTGGHAVRAGRAAGAPGRGGLRAGPGAGGADRARGHGASGAAPCWRRCCCSRLP